MAVAVWSDGSEQAMQENTLIGLGLFEKAMIVLERAFLPNEANKCFVFSASVRVWRNHHNHRRADRRADGHKKKEVEFNTDPE
ncbi:MAG: hypothetical protein DMG89_25225 [Acidobacteria bacterium]|jgi:hypothetical protein|nr:MAG: hypothetical protein DMG89_25225 [Acidobacteriota bacterium]